MKAPMRLVVAGVAAGLAVVALVLVIVSARPEIESGGGRWSERGPKFRDQAEASDPVAPSIEDRIPATPSTNEEAVEGIVERKANTADGEETLFGEVLQGSETIASSPEVQDTDDSLRPWEPRRVTELKLRLNAIAIAEWDEFYSVPRPLLQNMDFQEIVINRVARELGLDVERAKELRNLIETEQMDVGDAATKRFGDEWSIKNRLAGGDKTIWKEVREIRREIRADYESLYSKVFAEDEMEVINRHLRNTKMRFVSDSFRRKFWVCGVGE